MTVRKVIFVLSSIIAGLIILGIVLVRDWRKTEYGTLDTNAAILLKFIEISNIDPFEDGKTPEQIREKSAKSGALLKGSPTPIDQIRNTTFPGPAGPVPVRIYIPRQQSNLPVVIYYHGGGWMLGNLDSHDNICRFLAKKSSAVVVSVDYRLAPEHAFPAAANDAYAALEWVSQNAATFNGDTSRIFVAGDSAGGNLAAVVSLMSRDKGGPGITAQILIYPATNLADLTTESHQHFGNGYYLTRRYIEIFRSMYLPRMEDWQNVYASPLLAENLENLPPAMVLTAEFDVLRDEGEAYARKLESAGVPAKHNRYQGMIHGFLSMDRLFSQSKVAIDDIVAFIKSK
ncbi:alpha/beta hydrolase [bacterium]|nr:alpha/beta hydrolase [bacterium]